MLPSRPHPWNLRAPPPAGRPWWPGGPNQPCLEPGHSCCMDRRCWPGAWSCGMDPAMCCGSTTVEDRGAGCDVLCPGPAALSEHVCDQWGRRVQAQKERPCHHTWLKQPQRGEALAGLRGQGRRPRGQDYSSSSGPGARGRLSLHRRPSLTPSHATPHPCDPAPRVPEFNVASMVERTLNCACRSTHRSPSPHVSFLTSQESPFNAKQAGHSVSLFPTFGKSSARVGVHVSASPQFSFANRNSSWSVARTAKFKDDPGGSAEQN